MGWITRIFRNFFCVQVLYFWLIDMKEHTDKCKLPLIVFKYSWIFRNFVDFFEFFRLYSKVQIRDAHHKISQKIPHRTFHIKELSLGTFFLTSTFQFGAWHVSTTSSWIFCWNDRISAKWYRRYEHSELAGG